jgi:hypothetical protein
MQRLFIVAGVVLVVLGLAWPWLAKTGLGRLPGDIHVHRDGFSVHFPITTSLVISVIITLIFWLLRR